MFEGTPFNQPLNNWDISNVVQFDYMFSNALDFNQPLNNWDIHNGNDVLMRHVFDGAVEFNQDLSSWDVYYVTECNQFACNTPSWTLPMPNFPSCSDNLGCN